MKLFSYVAEKNEWPKNFKIKKSLEYLSYFLLSSLAEDK